MLWLLAGLLVASFALSGCPRTQSPDAGSPTSAGPPPAPAKTAPEAAPAALEAPANIGNAKNADGAYVCPVMGNALTELKKELSVEHEGKVYFFCCAGCPEKFQADPAKYLTPTGTEKAGEEAPEAAHAEAGSGHEGRDPE
jgi:YHS domain-containing protein